MKTMMQEEAAADDVNTDSSIPLLTGVDNQVTVETTGV